MSLFKREPRTVYRVYGEDEYFGDEQPVEVSGFEVMPPAEEIGVAAAEAPPCSGPGPSRRPLAVGLLATTAVGVLALVAAVTLGGAPSRVQRTAAAATTAPGAVEAHDVGATSSGEKSGAEQAGEQASHSRTPMRARVTMATTTTSRVGRSRAVPSHVRKGWASAGGGAASVSFTGSRSAAMPGAAAGAELGGEAYAPATPASQATAEFGFER